MTDQREQAAGWPDDEFSADLGRAAEHAPSTRTLGRHEAPAARERLGKAADQVAVLEPGSRLNQGSTYIDLDRLDDGPFVALAGQEVEEGQTVVAKSDLDYETWNQLIGRESPGEG